MDCQGAAGDPRLLAKLTGVLERALAELNSASDADVRLEHFAEALDPENPTICRLMCAIVKETLAPRRPSEPASPSTSLRGGVPIHGSLRCAHSPAVDGSGSWTSAGRRGRNASAAVDLDHVRNLMEAIEIVSPHMVGADLAAGASPIPEARGGWALPGQAAHSAAEHHALATSLGASGDPHSHAVRHRRAAAAAAAQTAHAHGAGIPIRPARPRARIDPVEFAEYAVAHMRPSPRFTPMGHGYPLSSSLTSDSRASLPRSFRAPLHPPLHLPRQHALDELHPAPPAGTSRPPPRADAA